jgi:catechol 2,3-dioxygenase-like lactoylglutathione lyase family enzyme
VIDCPDPRGLAAFYQELLGMQRVQDDDHWVVIGDAPDRPGVAFQFAPDLQPPRWPDPGHPQQMHLDVAVADIDQAENRAMALGARRLPGQGSSFRVYSDPVGHPFCLVALDSDLAGSGVPPHSPGSADLAGNQLRSPAWVVADVPPGSLDVRADLIG